MNIKSLTYYQKSSDTGGLTKEQFQAAVDAAMKVWDGWENPTGLPQLNAPTRTAIEEYFRNDQPDDQITTRPSLDTYVGSLKEQLK